MISRIIFICVLITYNTAFNTGKLRPYAILSKPDCQANKVYQKYDVTCFCNKYGRWPHKNCSLVFDEQVACKPNSFVQVDCNVCRCSESGTIEREFCTNHICTADPDDKIVFRRFNTKTKCDLNHWYVINSCRLCFCLTRENLLCAAKSHPKELQLGKYNLTDCGTEWLNDINKLLSSVNPLRIGDKSEKPLKPADKADIETAESQVVIEVQTTPKDSSETLNLNQENVGDTNVKIARNDDRNNENDLDSSSESNSEEKVEEGKAIARIAGNTVMPFENYEGNDNNNSNEAESDRREPGDESGGSNKESEEEDVSKEIGPAIDIDRNVPKIVKNDIDHESDDFLLKLSLPGMLGKVFNFAIRKSMVSITDSNCVPGSTLTVDCNACFCLTNHKLLCTKKICK